MLKEAYPQPPNSVVPYGVDWTDFAAEAGVQVNDITWSIDPPGELTIEYADRNGAVARIFLNSKTALTRRTYKVTSHFLAVALAGDPAIEYEETFVVVVTE